MLDPRACDTMTDVCTNLSTRHRESNKKADLGNLNALRPSQRDRTGRNVARGNIEARSRTGLVNHCKTPASFGALLISTTGAIDDSDFDPTRFLYDDLPSCRCQALVLGSQLGPPVSDLYHGLPRRSITYQARRSWNNRRATTNGQRHGRASGLSAMPRNRKRSCVDRGSCN